MKVLQVNCVYKKGSTGRITYCLHEELQHRNIDALVCYGRGNRVKEKNVYKTCTELESSLNHFISNLLGVVYGGCLSATNRLKRIISHENPDIVHLQCINGYFVNIYTLVEWLKKKEIKTVLTLHAEFMFTGGCGYSLECSQWKNNPGCTNCNRWKSETKSLFFNRTEYMWKRMYESFSSFKNNLVIVSVSPWLKQQAISSSIFEDKKHKVVLNGVDTSIFHRNFDAELRNKYRQYKKIIFHATSYFNLEPSHIKGGYYVNKLAEDLKNEGIHIVIAGPVTSQAEISDNITLLGAVNDVVTLAKYYSIADITLLTSQRETFSMVTAESLCCGTPVVGFYAGAPEQIAISDYSSFCDYGNIEELKRNIHSMINSNFDRSQISNRAIDTYSISKMVDGYVDIYTELLKE